ncbi:signal transduction histidine kinase/ActR/RegA family two-component response regulator [Actimicrobium sp. GrIS 1.19]|uniref:ATP-binding protein n=1 Tax=Actimicrobium sp. GrIS 1.19 TaxID=3071708 RepID=UPI002E0C5B99|nr:signal transduction histidine kinase/ActR/RegA family two-component response regulator [Actimicrobium sp. GrIS 1.19]
MKIRTQINCLLLFGALVIPATVGMALMAARHIEQDISDIRAAEDLIISAAQLSQVVVETALFHEARSQDQWQRKIASMNLQIGRMRPMLTAVQPELERIQKKIALMQTIYARLIRPPDTPDMPLRRPSALESAVEARSVASLLVLTQEVTGIAHELIGATRAVQAGTLRDMQIYIGLFLLAISALIGFVWHLVSRRILQPLRVFELATHHVAGGNYVHRLGLRQGDEIGELAAAFDGMAARVEKADVDLKAHRDNLAQEVVARTAELTAAKEGAEALSVVLLEKNVALEEARLVAEKADRAKSDFLSSMSHELRTPLNAILGFAQLIDSATPPISAAHKRYIEQILKGGWYLLELINEILDLALIESGKATLSPEPVSLLSLLLECRAMVEPQANAQQITLTFPQQHSAQFIEADRTRIKQVLINLLSNAIKYNHPGGEVAVDWTVRHADRLRITVRDTGSGMSEEQLGQLFQPFNRLGRETGAEEGTGIGLVVTKRLVDLMGGSIGVHSEVGVGSTFWIEFTVTSPKQLQHDDAETADQALLQVRDGLPQRTVLYVEDNTANLDLVEQLIARRPNLQLLSAANGSLGVEFARAHQPALVLMDINLPGISGVTAMKILQADPSTAHIPVIALSANAMPNEIQRGLDAGFARYLTKPIKVNEFMETLDEMLASVRRDAGTAIDHPASAFPGAAE